MADGVSGEDAEVGRPVEVEQVGLPGVGLRHDFATREGRRIGVVSHRDGRRDLVVYDRRGPGRLQRGRPPDHRGGGRAGRGAEPRLGPLAAAYVMVMAVLGPLLARLADPLTGRLARRGPPNGAIRSGAV